MCMYVNYSTMCVCVYTFVYTLRYLLQSKQHITLFYFDQLLIY